MSAGPCVLPPDALGKGVPQAAPPASGGQFLGSEHCDSSLNVALFLHASLYSESPL